MKTLTLAVSTLAFAVTGVACAHEPEQAAPETTQTAVEADTPVEQKSAFGPDSPFASEIYTFLVEDALFGPGACRTVFVGSSSIRFWMTLEDDFAELEPVNRGFGGSQIANVNAYFDMLLKPHQPREIVFYAGENDINAGVAPEEVANRFKAFMDKKTNAFGDAPVYFVSIKPSIARAGEFADQQEANELIKAYADIRGDLTFIDVTEGMMEDGQPKDIFIFDKLHMNLDGYKIWSDILRPVITNPDRPFRDGC